jgi:hypothetical protein
VGRCMCGPGIHCVVNYGHDGIHPQLVIAEEDLIVSGLPEFGPDVPRSRLHGRRITHFWTCVETLSTDIRDAMCGFRVYPVAEFTSVCESARIPRRMEFDVEVLVRAFWRGIGIRYIPTEVRYPSDGVSHFHLIRDNVRISLMHTRLCFGALVRLPWLLHRAMAGSAPGKH